MRQGDVEMAYCPGRHATLPGLSAPSCLLQATPIQDPPPDPCVSGLSSPTPPQCISAYSTICRQIVGHSPDADKCDLTDAHLAAVL